MVGIRNNAICIIAFLAKFFVAALRVSNELQYLCAVSIYFVRVNTGYRSEL